MQCLDYILAGVAKRNGKGIEVEGEDVTEEEGREYFHYIINPDGKYLNLVND